MQSCLSQNIFKHSSTPDCSVAPQKQPSCLTQDEDKEDRRMQKRWQSSTGGRTVCSALSLFTGTMSCLLKKNTCFTVCVQLVLHSWTLSYFSLQPVGCTVQSVAVVLQLWSGNQPVAATMLSEPETTIGTDPTPTPHPTTKHCFTVSGQKISHTWTVVCAS